MSDGIQAGDATDPTGAAMVVGIDGTGRWDLVGVLLALAAGACWATYIVAFPRLHLGDDQPSARCSMSAVVMAAAVRIPRTVRDEGRAGMLTDIGRRLGLSAQPVSEPARGPRRVSP